MVDVHLYGKLRRFAPQDDPRGISVLAVEASPGETIRVLLARIGIPLEELGSNLFLDGRYASLDAEVGQATRIGLFPDDMQLLYKWYFRPVGESPDAD
jgi:hypothetical protein